LAIFAFSSPLIDPSRPYKNAADSGSVIKKLLKKGAATVSLKLSSISSHLMSSQKTLRQTRISF
jgi:hypothetical protein